MRVPSARIRIDLHDESDTLPIEGVEPRIRLYGVDTLESKQTCDDASGRRYLCGSAAAEALATIFGRSGRFQCFEDMADEPPEL